MRHDGQTRPTGLFVFRRAQILPSLSLSPLLLLLLLDEKSRARVSRLLSSSRRCSLADLAKDWAIIKSWMRAAETYIA